MRVSHQHTVLDLHMSSLMSCKPFRDLSGSLHTPGVQACKPSPWYLSCFTTNSQDNIRQQEHATSSNLAFLLSASHMQALCWVFAILGSAAILKLKAASTGTMLSTLENSHASSNRSAFASDAALTFYQTDAALLKAQVLLHVNALSSFLLLTC